MLVAISAPLPATCEGHLLTVVMVAFGAAADIRREPDFGVVVSHPPTGGHQIVLESETVAFLQPFGAIPGVVCQ